MIEKNSFDRYLEEARFKEAIIKTKFESIDKERFDIKVPVILTCFLFMVGVLIWI